MASRDHWRPYASAVFGQLRRASLSVQLNIAEGYTFMDSPTFTRHLGIAYGSAVETGELLALARELDLIPHSTVTALLQHNAASRRLLLGMLKKRRTFDQR